MSQPSPKPSWKEEVNQRLEAHKKRKPLTVVPQSGAQDASLSVSERARRAAERVSARYSKAPSYSDMQANEARAALRAAETATRAALQAQAVAQAALANIQNQQQEEDDFFSDTEDRFEPHAPSAEEQSTWQPDPEEAVEDSAPAPGFAVRWDADLPPWPREIGAHLHSADTDEDVASPSAASYYLHDSEIHTVEAAQPIQANVIRFPREIVATRRMRPRLSGVSPSTTADSHGQLSIFEVDPATVSTEPVVSADAHAPAPTWSGPEWSGIQLEDHSEAERQARPERVPAVSNLPLAPLELRAMAAAVDIALVVCLVCAAVAGIAGHMHHALTLKAAEPIAFFATALIAMVYQAFFLTVIRSTPGMMYAGIALCTFDDEHPSRRQLRDRFFALLISVLPVGLGLAWALFDEDHLTWHDRLSRTYQRRC